MMNIPRRTRVVPDEGRVNIWGRWGGAKEVQMDMV